MIKTGYYLQANAYTSIIQLGTSIVKPFIATFCAIFKRNSTGNSLQTAKHQYFTRIFWSDVLIFAKYFYGNIPRKCMNAQYLP
ncbi:hypothetical protein [Clostridium thermosuccinogenes]|uniref:hypothetical protein n=1 Tax=Clostridium thermosuccinogenes TaxID=84032 RepID=UPI00137473AB|nr:hypothetical protein [Pseudoclostridium thermosuccinogenes]